MPTTDPAPREEAPGAYRFLVGLVRAVLPVLVTRRYEGLEHMPATGGALVVSNHTSNFDTLTLGDAVIRAGRWPRFLGKSDIWKVPVLGWFATQCRQIPVERHTARAKDSLVHAANALRDGDVVAIFPEGTITRDPAMWPMVARHGASRLALTTGVPVIPVAQVGAHQVLGGKHLEFRKLFSLRRRPIHIVIGEPMDFSDLTSDEPTDEAVAEATRRTTQRLTEMLADMRGEAVPELIWNDWDKAYVSRES